MATWIWPTSYSLPTLDIKDRSPQPKLRPLSGAILAPERCVGPAGIGAELQSSTTSPSAHFCSFSSFSSLDVNIPHAVLRIRVCFPGNLPCTPLKLGVVCYTAIEDRNIHHLELGLFMTPRQQKSGLPFSGPGYLMPYSVFLC